MRFLHPRRITRAVEQCAVDGGPTSATDLATDIRAPGRRASPYLENTSFLVGHPSRLGTRDVPLSCTSYVSESLVSRFPRRLRLRAHHSPARRLSSYRVYRQETVLPSYCVRLYMRAMSRPFGFHTPAAGRMDVHGSRGDTFDVARHHCNSLRVFGLDMACNAVNAACTIRGPEPLEIAASVSVLRPLPLSHANLYLLLPALSSPICPSQIRRPAVSPSAPGHVFPAEAALPGSDSAPGHIFLPVAELPGMFS